MKFSKDDKIRIYDIISRFESVFLGKSQETNYLVCQMDI